MKKNYSGILFSFLGLCSMLMISNKACSQTNVTGGLYSNATWTAANSPYVISDTLVIFSGVTLTIQPGVVVKFDSLAWIDQLGNLTANGTASDSIIFTSGSTNPHAGIYQGIYIEDGVDSFKYCRFSYASAAINAPNTVFAPPVSHCVFTFNDVGIDNYFLASVDTCTFKYNGNGISLESLGLYINDCIFIGNSVGISGFSGDVTNSVFTGNNYGIQDGGIFPSVIQYCTFDSNTTCGIYIDGDTIRNCVIQFNGIGIGSEDNIVSMNDISDNTVGIETVADEIISCNTICNNTQYNIRSVEQGNVNASDNFWCLMDSTGIQATIYDAYQNISLGFVYFTPFDTIACDSVDTTTGINRIISASPANFTLYPNPASNNFILQTTSTGTQLLQVFDITGKLILSQNICNSKTAIDAGNYADGIYFVNLKGDGGVATEKLVVVR